MKSLLIIFIKFYKKAFSPFLPKSCRFHPTCSEYAINAIAVHGIFKGIFMSIKRILKCNPFFKGGYDPVPGKYRHIHLNRVTNIDLKKHYEIL